MSCGCYKCIECKNYTGEEYPQGCTKGWPADTPTHCRAFKAKIAAVRQEKPDLVDPYAGGGAGNNIAEVDDTPPE